MDESEKSTIPELIHASQSTLESRVRLILFLLTCPSVDCVQEYWAQRTETHLMAEMESELNSANDPVNGNESRSALYERTERPALDRVEKAILSLAFVLELKVERKGLSEQKVYAGTDDPLAALIEGAEQAGIFLRETRYRGVGETFELVRQGYPVVFCTEDATLVVLEQLDGRSIESSIINDELVHKTIRAGAVEKLLGNRQRLRMLVAKKELECDSLSSSPGHSPADDEHQHLTPMRRVVALLSLERRDIGLVILFAGVAGVLSLASPLVVEGLVNVVSWGTYFQPLLVLAGMLMTCLGIAGVLKVLQTWVVEIIQRRQFVRIVNDLAHRFPRANQESLASEYPRELANRVFDIMTIQKATATLLLDGVSIVLTTILGLILLGFYHPFLLGFDIVLVISMISITWLLGRGGIRTAVAESRTKYKVAHWLQDVISMPAAFKTGGGEALAINRANQLMADYVNARKRQFRVVIRQVIFAVGLQVIASTAVLGLGGWLVINRELTLGQLVASELIVTVVVGAFAKAGKSLEKFYDLMAGIDKVGHLLDIPPDPRTDLGDIERGPVRVQWSELAFVGKASRSQVGEATINAGSRVAIVGDDSCGKSLLAKTLAGLWEPSSGTIQVGDFDAFEAAIGEAGMITGYAGQPQIFHGSVAENIDLGRVSVSNNRVREVVDLTGLGPTIMQLDDGLQTKLQTEGYPLSSDQQARLMIARAIATKPGLLVVDGLLDYLDSATCDKIWATLSDENAPWTLILVTGRDDLAERCETKLAVRK